MEIRPIVSALLRSKTGAVLIAAQVALTLAIVCNALFVIEARLATAARPSGADEAATFHLLYIGSREIDDRAAMVRRDLEVLRAIPGVVAAADTNQIPLGRSGWGLGLSHDPSKPAEALGGSAYFSGGSLIDALGLELVAGRDFTPAEVVEVDARRGEPKAGAVILSRRLAGRLWPSGGPLGKTIYLGTGGDAEPMRVVGVVDRLMTPWGQANDDAFDSFILPIRYLGNFASYAVRAAPGERDRVMVEADKALAALRPDRVRIANRALDEVRDERYAGERAGAAMLVAVTIGLLLVTASGIVGIASLWVSQRRKQIGVRRALGARRVDVLRYFLLENLVITTAGLVAGLVLAFVVNQLLGAALELERLPLRFVGIGAASLWVLGLVAVFGPAWRAAAVPPAVATRGA